MIFRANQHNGRLYYWGAIWPKGRSVAADEAQIRQCERDLAALETNNEKGNAA